MRYEQQWGVMTGLEGADDSRLPGVSRFSGVSGVSRVSGVSGDSGTRGSGPVQSVDRAVAILEILARDGEAGVTEVARELDVHK